MKLVLDHNVQSSRIDTKAQGHKIDISNATITKSPYDAFARFYNGNLAEDLNLAEVSNLAEAYAQVDIIREAIRTNSEIAQKFDARFTSDDIKKYRSPDEFYLQKITYKIADNEDIQVIADALKNQTSGAFMRAIEIDEAKREIISYSTTHGLWDVNGSRQFKAIESHSADKIRTTYTYRKLEDVGAVQDPKRLNYAIFEDAATLLNADLIENFYKTNEQPDGTFKDDSLSYYATKAHFAVELSEEMQASIATRAEAVKTIKAETTHVNKPSATVAEMSETIEANSDEIHTVYEMPKIEINEAVENVDETIAEQTNAIVAAHMARLEAELKARQDAEREALRLKIEQAKTEREGAKAIFLKSLANGNTLQEAQANLAANKFNDITVAAVMEDVKAEIILSTRKDELLAKEKSEHIKTGAELEKTIVKLDETENARAYNYNRYTEEVTKRKGVEEIVRKAFAVNSALKAEIETKDATIVGLNETIETKDEEIKELSENLEVADKMIVERNNTITSKDAEIAGLNETIKSKDAEIEAKGNEFRALQTVADAYKQDNEAKEAEIEAMKATIHGRDEKIDELEDKIKTAGADINELKAMIEIYKAEAVEKDKEIEAMKATIHGRDEKIDKLEDKIKAKDKKVNELEQYSKRVEKENEELKKENEGKGISIVKLTKDIADLKEKFDKVIGLNNDLKSTVETITAENNKLLGEIRKVEAIKEKMEAKLEAQAKQAFSAVIPEEQIAAIKEAAEKKTEDFISGLGKEMGLTPEQINEIRAEAKSVGENVDEVVSVDEIKTIEEDDENVIS